VPEEADAKRAQAEQEFNLAKKATADKKKEIKKRGLKGKERTLALEREHAPLEDVCDDKRDLWLEALSAAVPRPELALGKRIDCTSDEYRGHALALFGAANHTNRESLDLLAAFGSDACQRQRSDEIEPTPFCFITGSGHQYFLDTVRQLMDHVSPERVRQALFDPWTYRDEGLSMRWDPLDDRRYALMDRDPTASDNKSRTVWMANLLGYRSLALFPAAWRRGGLGVTAWTDLDDEAVLTWPIWDFDATPDVIRSLLELRELRNARPDPRLVRARGIATVFRARRIKVGSGANYKWNFTPASAVVGGAPPVGVALFERASRNVVDGSGEAKPEHHPKEPARAEQAPSPGVGTRTTATRAASRSNESSVGSSPIDWSFRDDDDE
jgi:hypothetical protein